MAAFIENLYDELLTVLRADLGDNDLSTVSGTVRVDVSGSSLLALNPPYVVLAPPTFATEYRAAHNDYELSGEIEWFGFAAAADLDLFGKMKKAVRLASEVMTAIQDAHHNSARTYCYQCMRLLPSVTGVFYATAEVPDGVPQVHGRIEFLAYINRGA